jgi:hypothetical protein
MDVLSLATFGTSWFRAASCSKDGKRLEPRLEKVAAHPAAKDQPGAFMAGGMFRR